MSRSSILNVNAKLCRVLGIDMHNVTAVELSMRGAYQLPQLTISKFIFGDDITETQQLFELRALGSAMSLPQPEPEPLDLDAMCEAAMARVTRRVVLRCKQASAEITGIFYALQMSNRRDEFMDLLLLDAKGASA